MKIISLFPTGSAATKPSKPGVHVGPVHFTCPHCRVASKAEFDKMIFRSIDFLCGSCNHSFKLVNPGFVPPETKPNLRK
jgi:hypothetical protein